MQKTCFATFKSYFQRSHSLLPQPTMFATTICQSASPPGRNSRDPRNLPFSRHPSSYSSRRFIKLESSARLRQLAIDKEAYIELLCNVGEEEREIARRKEEHKLAMESRNAYKDGIRRSCAGDLETGGSVGVVDGLVGVRLTDVFLKCAKRVVVGLAMGALIFAAEYVWSMLT